MKTISDQLAEESQGLLSFIPEPGDTSGHWTAFNDGGVENPTGEFLFGLIRLMKPNHVLETGTHYGVGAAYLGAACRANGFGKVTTIEFLKPNFDKAATLFSKLGLTGWVDQVFGDVASYDPGYDIDFLFLDTEPQTRFAELLKFFPKVKPGGFIAIHDLHYHMHQIPNEDHGWAWPYGEIPEGMNKLVVDGHLRPFHFRTPRGLTMFYKSNSSQDYDWTSKKAPGY